jgi:hypothetical protein
MSFWVSAYCHRSVLSLTAKDLIVGIADRLQPLAYQFPGDRAEEETPEAIQAVLKRLCILPADAGKPFRHHALNFLDGGPDITTVYFGPEDAPGIIEQEVLPGRLAALHGAEAKRVKELLRAATESVSFALKVTHTTGIGFPLAVAAAATLVSSAGGIIRSGTSSWMVPAGREVDIILEYDE